MPWRSLCPFLLLPRGRQGNAAKKRNSETLYTQICCSQSNHFSGLVLIVSEEMEAIIPVDPRPIFTIIPSSYRRSSSNCSYMEGAAKSTMDWQSKELAFVLCNIDRNHRKQGIWVIKQQNALEQYYTHVLLNTQSSVSFQRQKGHVNLCAMGDGQFVSVYLHWCVNTLDLTWFNTLQWKMHTTIKKMHINCSHQWYIGHRQTVPFSKLYIPLSSVNMVAVFQKKACSGPKVD